MPLFRFSGAVPALATVAVLACTGQPGRRQIQPAGNVNSADVVIARYLRAVGGASRVAKIRSRRLTGTYVEGPMHATTDMVWRRPDLRRVNVHAPGFEYSEGFDGTTWEYSFQTSTLKRPGGAAADAGRRGAEFDESFIDYRVKGHVVARQGEELLGGTMVDRLKVSLADGWEKLYYFDQRSGLILAMRKAMPLHATGPAITSLVMYEDWRKVDGVRQPHRFVEREATTGRLMNTLQWDRIEANPVLNDAELRPPAGR